MSWLTDLLAPSVTKAQFDALSARVAKLESPAASVSYINDRYGTADIGPFFVQNNRWNDAAGDQMLAVYPNGFKVISAVHNLPQNGPPASYPSIVYGYHYGRASIGTVLPKKLSSMKSLNSSVTVTYPNNDAVYDCAYDIWCDSTAKTTGQNDTEIMIWLNHTGNVQPVGTKNPSMAYINGTEWELWKGNIGWDVYSFVSKLPMTSFSSDLKQFIPADLDKYLTSVQFGFEPWVKGAGLSVDAFKVEIG